MSEPTETVVTETATQTAVAVKAPSKKSQADAIFAARLADRAAGFFKTNSEFRNAVLKEIMETVGVSVASAATMYNSAKKEAEAANPTIGLGRDPKKEKPVSSGKRGRPVGSKNKPKVVAPADGGTVVVTTTEPPAPVNTEEAAPAA